MKLIWQQHAELSVRRIANYVGDYFGKHRMNAFLKDVRRTARLIRQNPYIGSIDPLFDGRAMTYRSMIVNGLSKLVYYVDGDTIYVAAFWDTRQEPNNQASVTP